MDPTLRESVLGFFGRLDAKSKTKAVVMLRNNPTRLETNIKTLIPHWAASVSRQHTSGYVCFQPAEDAKQIMSDLRMLFSAELAALG